MMFYPRLRWLILMISLSLGQIAFLIAVPSTVIIAIAVLIILLRRRHLMKKEYKFYYYKRIYKIAMDKDYYLINNFLFKIDDSHVGRIDHILFADKYIYVMTDSYFNGDIIGKEDDKSIIVLGRDGKKYYDDNPLMINKKLVTKLSVITGINLSMIIGLCVINDNCQYGIHTTNKSFYLIQSNKIKALIKAIESRPVGAINKDQLASAVKAIDKLNRRKRSGERK